jgi:TldD protein
MFQDTRNVNTESLRIVLENGKVDDISYSKSNNTITRVFKNGFWGYHINCNNRKAMENLLTIEETCKDEQKPYGILYPKERPKNTYYKPKIDQRDIDTEEKIRFLKEIDVKNVKSVKISYFEESTWTHYQNEEFEVSSYYPRIGVSILCIARSGNILQMAKESRAMIGGWELVEKWNLQELADKASSRALNLLTAHTVKGGSMRVLLDQQLGGVFIHEAVGHAMEADSVLEGRSILSDTLGKKIASECLTVVDDPTLDGFGSYAFDDEGVPSSRHELIKEGVHVGYLHSTETSSILSSVPIGGNARAEGASKPLVRMSNTFVVEGDMGLDEMLCELGNGLYL